MMHENNEKPTVEWENPPRTINDEATDVVKTLCQDHYVWARVGTSMSARKATDWVRAIRREGDFDGNYMETRMVRVDSDPIATLFEGLRRYDVYARAKKEPLP